MKVKTWFLIPAAILGLSFSGGASLAWAQHQPTTDPADRAQVDTAYPAMSPWGDDSIAILIEGLAVGVLVTGLLVLGFLAVNLGLMSKRREDRLGGRTPSDVGILQENVWPESQGEQRFLPAMESDEEGYVLAVPRQSLDQVSVNVLGQTLDPEEVALRSTDKRNARLIENTGDPSIGYVLPKKGVAKMRGEHPQTHAEHAEQRNEELKKSPPRDAA